MPKPLSPFLELIDKRQEGLISPWYFTHSARGNLIKKVLLTQELLILPSPTRGCTMKVCDDWFMLAPSRSSNLLLFKYDTLKMGYMLKEALHFPSKPSAPPYKQSDHSRFAFKLIDLAPHAFSATNCDRVLHYGDPYIFKMLSQVQHPSDISQHRIGRLCPFNIVAAGYNGEIYVSDMRSGAVCMTFTRTPRPGFTEHSVAWSTYSDRVVCSLVNTQDDDTFPLSIFDLRKPNCNIGPRFACNFFGCSVDILPFVEFLNTGVGNLVVTLVNDSHVRIWNIWDGLKQTIIREKSLSKFDHVQPAILQSHNDSFIFVPDRTGIKVHSCSKLLYSIKCPSEDVSMLGYSELHNHIIGLSSYSFKKVYVWECGKSKD